MIGSIGVGVLFCVGVVLSLRLVLLSVRQRELPPLLVAAALVLLGPVSVVLSVASVSYAALQPDLANTLSTAAAATSTLGVACAAFVTAVVFREGNRLGWITTCTLVAAMFFCVAASTLTGGVDVRRTPDGWRLGYQMLRLGTLLWAAVEALVTWRMLRRRIRLGLADPLAVNRIGLWGIAAGIGSTGASAGFLFTFFGVEARSTGVEVLLSALGLAASAALWLSFLPPARYQAWVRSRHPEAPEAQANGELAQRWPAR